MIHLNQLAFADAEKNSRQKQIEEILKAREEMIKSFFGDDSFDTDLLSSKFNKHIEDLMRNFDRDSFFNQNQNSEKIVGEYDWKDSGTHLDFVLKVKQIKDRPLAIKIEKGQIKISGDLESIQENKKKKTKIVSKVHFEKSFSIPSGVDQTSPLFENKEGELIVKFKKLAPSKKDRLPLEKDANDLTL